MAPYTPERGKNDWNEVLGKRFHLRLGFVARRYVLNYGRFNVDYGRRVFLWFSDFESRAHIKQDTNSR